MVNRRKVEAVTDFIVLGSKITADGNYNHEIKRHLLLRRKVMTNLDSVLKSREITLLTKVCLVKAMVFPVIMYGCETWTIKKWLSTQELMFLNCGAGEDSWESTVLQGDKTINSKGNQPWIFIGRTDAEVEALILWPRDAKSWLIEKDWCWETLKVKGEKGSRGWDGWMASLTQWAWIWANSGRQWRTGKPGVLQSMGWQRVGHDLVTEQQQKTLSHP